MVYLSYIIVILMFTFIPLLFYYLFGALANVKLMYKMKRKHIPHKLKFLYVFTGLGLSKSGNPSYICYLFESFAMINFILQTFISIFILSFGSSKLYATKFAFFTTVIEMVIYIGLVIYVPFYVKNKRKTTHRKR